MIFQLHLQDAIDKTDTKTGSGSLSVTRLVQPIALSDSHKHRPPFCDELGNPLEPGDDVVVWGPECIGKRPNGLPLFGDYVSMPAVFGGRRTDGTTVLFLRIDGGLREYRLPGVSQVFKPGCQPKCKTSAEHVAEIMARPYYSPVAISENPSIPCDAKS
jgi:hypothetical protein